MPADLLMATETSPPVAGGLEAVDKLTREAERLEIPIGVAVEGMKGCAAKFERMWGQIVVEVAKGHTNAIHQMRERLASAMTERLDQIKDTHAVATWLRKRGPTHLPDPDILLPEIVALERLKSNVFDRWQTAEDLEDLAARDYPLSSADLDQIGPQRRPPAAFYAEESKPF